MAGNKAGGKAAAATNKAKYGPDFYKRIGARGGRLGTTGGFWADRELARRAGAIGGSRSKRKSLATPEELEERKERRRANRRKYYLRNKQKLLDYHRDYVAKRKEQAQQG